MHVGAWTLGDTIGIPNISLFDEQLTANDEFAGLEVNDIEDGRPEIGLGDDILVGDNDPGDGLLFGAGFAFEFVEFEGPIDQLFFILLTKV